MLRPPSRRLVGAAVLAFGLGIAAGGLADDRTAETRRLLELLTGLRIAYQEAFEDGAELASLTEVEEARLLLAEARTLNDRLHVLPPDAFPAIARDLDSLTGRVEVPARIAALAAEVTARTGVALETRPPAGPSAARGRQLYAENCAGCHGPRGAGDGPDAAATGITPADFTSTVFMRRETPLEFFTMITIGHRRRGMPEWTALDAQQRWDLVAYVWGLTQSDGDRAAGARVWSARCAGCHGAAGAGVPGKAGALTRPGSLVERSDRTLFVGLFRAPHAAATQGLTDAERWQVVAHARALSLGGAEGPRPAPARRRRRSRRDGADGESGRSQTPGPTSRACPGRP